MKLNRIVVLAFVASAAFALASCGKSTSITSATPNLDPAPPAAPALLTSDYVENIGYDYLHWNRSSSPSVTGYEIWESATQGGTAVKIQSVTAAANFVVLPAVTADCTRFYEVRAKSSTGLYSAFSSPIAVDRHVIVSVGGGSSGNGGNGIGNRIQD